MMARKKKGLSDRHRKVLEVLEFYNDEQGYPPSIRDIGKAADISSTSVVNYYLEQLEEWGYLERDRKVSRGVRLLKTADGERLEGSVDTVQIPLAGRIGASFGFELPSSDFNYFDTETSVDVARTLLPSDASELYAVEISGESMVDAMINDGDIVIMKHAREARNGEMVAVRVNDDDELTLKYFFRENGGVRLQPANPTMEAVFIDDPKALEVQGKVVLVIRQVGVSPI
jgi:repressor LexA